MEDKAKKFAFVTWDEPGSVNRKLIRSHCMRGKNKRKPVEQPTAQWLGHDDGLNPSARPLLLSFSVLPMHGGGNDPKFQRPTTRRKRHILTPEQLSAKTASSNIIPYPIPNTSLLRFADNLDRESVELLFTFFPGALRSYSLADFNLLSDLESPQWEDWLRTDVAYVNAAITVSAAVRNLLFKQEQSRISSAHLRKAICQLNKNLSDESLSLSDANIAVIISLSMASCISQDHVSTTAHAAGLREIVRLRGGLDSFCDNPQLQVGMTRIDLLISLGSGRSPIFTTSPSTFPYGSSAIKFDTRRQQSDAPDLQSIDDLVDHRVAAIFRDLQSLTQAMNDATSAQRVMIASDFHAGFMSIQYRLFGHHNKLEDITSELIRVAMLASLTTTFQVLGSRIKYEYLTKRLRELCCAVEVSTERLQHVMFWVLMVGRIALFDSGEDWLREKWRLEVLPLTRELQWKDAKGLLKEFIWIDACNEKAGIAVFNKMMQDLDDESRHRNL